MGTRGSEYPGVQSLRQRLVGREGELETLGDLLGRTLRGEGCTLVLEGEAGIGKTALLGRLEEMASQGGMWVWIHRMGGMPEAPLGPFGAALRACIQTLPGNEKREVQDRFREIAPALSAPVLGEETPEGDAGREEPTEDEAPRDVHGGEEG